MTNTLMRHRQMLREIPRYPRKISTSELKTRLGAAGHDTTLRTIQRDLSKLSVVLPLQGDDSNPQGWSWHANAEQFELPTLEPQAALVFHLTERYLQSLLPSSTLEYMSPWFKAASGVLDNQGNGLSEWRKKVRVLAPGQPLMPPEIDHEIQATVTQALLLNRRLALTYRPRGAEEEKEYEASPLGLVVRDQVIYLVCTLREYKDIKQLVLSRMRSAAVLEKPANGLEGFDLDQYIEQGEFGIPLESGKAITLVADFDRSAARTFIERPLERNQKIEEIGVNAVRLTATVPDTKELRRWLLQFGSAMKVISPSFLRTEFCQMFSEMTKLHSE